MYSPPRHPLEVLQKLNFDEAIGPTDPRFVDTDAARGGRSIQTSLARKFGLDLSGTAFYPTHKKHAVLFGPIGSGKSTELLRLVEILKPGKRLYPILLNVRGEVDINNLQYADVLLALATAVVRTLDAEGIPLPEARIRAINDWFNDHVATEERVKELVAEIRSEAEAALSIPFMARLMSRLTTVFKSSSVYKDTLREVVRKTFTQFAQAFNELVAAAETALQERQLAERLLLIVDGTDKITLDDANRLFIYETEQLLTIEALVLYTAPITLKYGGAGISKLDTEEVLSIIKLRDRDGQRFDPGWAALHALLDRRIDPAAFADPALKDTLIDASGGHPRELLRLLRLACELCETDCLDAATVEKAVAKLAADYRYWLQPEDYACLADVDFSRGAHIGNDERTRNLLWRLALLQYNDGSWRGSHPAVRTLEGYRSAWDALVAAKPPGSSGSGKAGRPRGRR